MSKKARKQKTKKTKQSQQTIGTKKENKRKLPSLKETEAYIKEHNLKVMDHCLTTGSSGCWPPNATRTS